MNVIFVDFDGVLNSKQHFLMVKEKEVKGKDTPKEADLEFMKSNTNPNNMWCLKYILDNVPNLKIVLSTSWRNHFEINLFKELFQFYGLDAERIIGKTPKKFSSERVHEIHMWLDDQLHSPDTWVALDDHPIFQLEYRDKQNEYLTDSWVGLTILDSFKIIKHFNKDFKEPVILI
jgi:hypothetical protein